MTLRSKQFVFLLAGVWMLAACRSPDPARQFIAEIDRGPAGERPRNWGQTKALMARPAPVRGEVAPDFTLSTLAGTETITRSAYQAGRPLVLIFGSFT